MVDTARLAEMGIEVTHNPPHGRGCGDRKEAEPYGCCGTSPYGEPIEKFIIDPARVWPTGWQRGVIPIQRKSGVYDVAVFLGKEHWPSPWDKVEEIRRYGESRRFPKNFPFHLLTPGKSRMLFVHAYAIPAPDFFYQLNRDKPLEWCDVFKDDMELWNDPSVLSGWHPGIEEDGTPCTYALRDLAYLVNDNYYTHPIWEDKFVVTNPSFDYFGKFPNPYVYPEQAKWVAGLFMALPLTHWEFKGKSDPEVEQRVKEAGFESVVLDW